MKVNYFKLILLLLFISPFYLHAQQIQKGLTSLNGAAQFSHRKYKNYSANQFALEPNYGKFITKHLMLGAEAKFRFDKYDRYPYIFEQDHSVYAQYYFNPQNKWTLFSELSFDITSVKTNTDLFYLSPFSSIGVSGGLGVNRFINQEIAFQGTLIYSRNPNLREGFNYHDHYGNSLGLTLSLTNFINFNRDSISNSLRKGRQIINGNINVLAGEGDTKVSAHLDYGYFISKNFLIGATAQSVFYIPSPLDRGIGYYIYPYIQYYNKIHNKLYAHIKGSVGILDSRVLDHPFAFGVSGGLDYFLTPYTLIEMNLIDYKRSILKDSFLNLSRYDFSFGPQVSVRYFLR